MTAAYQLSNIEVRYGHHKALDITELTLASNACTALLGENGAGKSTLMKLLAFVQTPSAGDLTLLGEHISGELSAEQRRKIGFVSQQPYLLNGTVLDNLKLALKLQKIHSAYHQKWINQALETVNLAVLASQDAATLSGGELKRAAIARAIVYQPDILLLDEPFSHLDQRHIHELENTIQNFARQQNKTVIFSTHDRLQAMAIADDSINLVSGRVTTTPLLNLFHGHCHQQLFDTGKMVIHVSRTNTTAKHIAIDPREIIISDQELSHSSMLNSFQGRLIQIAEEADQVRLLVDCGERFHAIITSTSLRNLSLHLGDTVWLNFKATAVSVF
jgi:molybdopterin-binding protein